jgi:hypothetical protein
LREKEQNAHTPEFTTYIMNKALIVVALVQSIIESNSNLTHTVAGHHLMMIQFGKVNMS